MIYNSLLNVLSTTRTKYSFFIINRAYQNIMVNMYKNIKFEINNGVATLLISRPNRHNAINLETMNELEVVVRILQEFQDLRCLIISGDGDSTFISGGDIKELHSIKNHEQALSMNRKMGSILSKIEKLDAFVIVAINGIAIGGGAEITLIADRRLIIENSKISFKQASLGIICGWGGVSRLVRLVGRSKSLEILLLDDSLTSEKALEYGLVDEICKKENIMNRAYEIADKLSTLPILAVKGMKKTVIRVDDMPFDRALEYEAEIFSRTWASEEHFTAVEKFIADKKSKSFK